MGHPFQNTNSPLCSSSDDGEGLLYLGSNVDEEDHETREILESSTVQPKSNLDTAEREPPPESTSPATAIPLPSFSDQDKTEPEVRCSKPIRRAPGFWWQGILAVSNSHFL